MCGPDDKSVTFGAWVAQMEERQTLLSITRQLMFQQCSVPY